MKRLLCAALLAVTGIAAAADDLAEANRFLAAKDYGKALPLYQRLAEAGNAEAQLRLGEMLWFGDGAPADLDKAARWFEKSAAAGNADAAASLASLKRRETHGHEITYWTGSYQGEDLVGGRFACKLPAFPLVSRTRAEIDAVDAAIAQWRNCHNAQVDNLNDALPPGKRIPAEVLDMMTPAEAAQAQRHLDTVYGRIIKDTQQQAALFSTQEAAWKNATQAHAETERKRTEAIKADLLRQQQDRMHAIDSNRPSPPPVATQR